MTIKEAVRAELQNIVASDDIIDKTCEDNRLNSADIYTYAKNEVVARCAVEVLLTLMSSQDIVEGGMTISNRFSLVKERINFLIRKYGWTDININPVVRASNPW